MTTMKAIILAAGRGERLKPLTLSTPKPLIKVAGISLIERQILKLKAAGFINLIINLHHLGEQIRGELGDGKKMGVNISYSFEENLLDTAGGIANVLSFFENSPFAMVSADVVSDFDFKVLANVVENKHQQNLIVLVNNPEYHQEGDFYFNPQTKDVQVKTANTINIDRSTAGLELLTFSGFAVFTPTCFAEIPANTNYPLKTILNKLALANNLQGIHYNGVYFDCGNLQRLQLAQKYLLKN